VEGDPGEPSFYWFYLLLDREQKTDNSHREPDDRRYKVGLQESRPNVDPVVGWLVCMEGPDRGRDFRLHAEKNFIGRSAQMDVCVLSDDRVSSEKHGVVIFDPKQRVFWTLPGDSGEAVYLNGEILHRPCQLKRDDVLELGQTKLVLIPFCGDKYNWLPAPAKSGT